MKRIEDWKKLFKIEIRTTDPPDSVTKGIQSRTPEPNLWKLRIISEGGVAVPKTLKFLALPRLVLGDDYLRGSPWTFVVI